MLIGDIDVHPLTNGTFRAAPEYFGEHVRAEGHEDLFAGDGMAFLPIGCFLVRTRDRTILVDAGMGPRMRDDGRRRLLIGGQLPLGLRAVGVAPPDVTDVICTHLHADHCGWLFDAAGRAVLPSRPDLVRRPRPGPLRRRSRGMDVGPHPRRSPCGVPAR